MIAVLEDAMFLNFKFLNLKKKNYFFIFFQF